MQEKLYTAGDYVVLAYPDPLVNVKTFTGFTDSIVNEGAGTIFRKEFRYSYDSETFSEFSEINVTNLNSLAPTPEQQIWFQFRYSLMSGGPAVVNNVVLQYDLYPVDNFKGLVAPNIQSDNYALPITYKNGAKWEPYKINKAVRLYKDLNLMVNSLFGHEVHYYRALPQGRSKDVFLMEYSLYEHDERQCIKVMVPNNEFPDNKLNMGPFGVDFEMPFEIQVDKDYFQSIFGEGSGPQKRDVIYFPRTGRIYEISSSYLFRDFMNEPLYFKATLIKWLPKSNAEPSTDLSALEALTMSAEKLFGKEMKEEEIDIANPVQFNPTTEISDPVREYLAPLAEILDEPVMNYFLTVAEHQYNLSKTVSENMASVNLTVAEIMLLSLEKTYYARTSNTQTYSTTLQETVGASGGSLPVGATSFQISGNNVVSGSLSFEINGVGATFSSISYSTSGVVVNFNSPVTSGNYEFFYKLAYPDSIESMYSMKKLKYKGLTPEGEAVFEYSEGFSQFAENYVKSSIFDTNSIFSLYETEYSASSPGAPLIECKNHLSKSYQQELVKYKATNEFNVSQDRAISAWFRIKSNTRFSAPLVSISYDDFVNEITISYDRKRQFFVGDTISISRKSGGNFNIVGKIKSITDQNTAVLSVSDQMMKYIGTVFSNSWLSYTDLQMQLAYPKVFVDSIKQSKGIRVELIGKRYFVVTANTTEYYFILPNTQTDLAENKWYSVCVSFSNLFSQLTLNVWEMQWNPSTGLPATSDLKIVYGNTVKGFPKENRSSGYFYNLKPSDMEMTNIRVWSQKIETDKQPLVLNQNIVKEASLAIVIDNAVPVSKLPYISYTH